MSDNNLFERDLASLAGDEAEARSLREIWQDLGDLPVPEPSAALRAQFYQRLNALSKRAGKPQPAWRMMYQVAAGIALFALGLSVGRFNAQKTERPEIAQLQNQMEGLRQTVAISLMEKPSASSRLQGVEWSGQVDRPDQDLLTALLTTLNQDQNTNVRLAALDALEKFTSDAGVRKGLEQSITTQQSPLVQIALIDALVHIRDSGATPEFKQLSGNHAVNAVVRQRAQWAIDKLSSE